MLRAGSMRAAGTNAIILPALFALAACTPSPRAHPRAAIVADQTPPPTSNEPRDAASTTVATPPAPRPDLPRQQGIHCPIAFDDADVILANVGDTVITACDLAVMSEMDTREGLPPSSPHQLLDRAVREAMFASEARARGLDHDVDVGRRVRDTLAAALVRSEALATAGWAAPTDEEIAAYYRAHQDDFTSPERVHLREIVLADEAAARDVITALASTPFDDLLARTVSREGQRDRGDLGLVPPGGNDRIPREVADAGFALVESGAVSPTPVRVESVEYEGSGRHRRAHTRVTFHVVQLLGRVEGATVPLADAARQIRFRMAFGHYQVERQSAEERLLTVLRSEHPPSVNANAVRHAHVRRPEPAAPEPAPTHHHGH